MQIAMTLQAWYPTDNPMLMLMMQNPTIAGLADAIAAVPSAQSGVAATTELLEQLTQAEARDIDELFTGKAEAT
jgi:hypothetical protein